VIVVDSSAVCAFLFNEPEADRFDEILADRRAILPASCLVESSIAWRRRGSAPAAFDALLRDYEFEILPFDERQAWLAAEADRRYGRGTRHPAQLNFGDCLAYAAAMALTAPLLFKGGDFVHTDVSAAA
jgi:ribonuclease VapC